MAFMENSDRRATAVSPSDLAQYEARGRRHQRKDQKGDTEELQNTSKIGDYKKSPWRDLMNRTKRALLATLHIDGHNRTTAPAEAPRPETPPHLEDHFPVDNRVSPYHARGSAASMDSMSSFVPNNKMLLERVKLVDVNGLVGKCHRSPITGCCYLKEVESWRDFALVDLWSRKKIVALPEDHAGDTHLFLPRTLNARTWFYHSKWRKAYAAHQVGMQTEAFLFEALAARCIDIPVQTGLWSPVMVYAPLVPFTALCDDQTVFIASLFIMFISLIVSVIMNHHILYFYTRLPLLPLRLGFLVLTAIRIGGGGLQLLGYVVTILAALFDIVWGDLAIIGGMQYYSAFEIVKTLPNQVFVCYRTGNNWILNKKMGKEKCREIPEKITGMKDPMDGSLFLVANVQGVLIELEPVDPDDGAAFKEEHTCRLSDPSLGNLRYHGTDLFSVAMKTAMDYYASREKIDMLQKLVSGRLGSKSGLDKKADMTVEDIA